MQKKETYDDYCPVDLEQVRVQSNFPYDVFIKLASDNFVKILNAGDTLDAKSFAKFNNKSVKVLYLSREDFARYVGINDVGALSVLSEAEAEKFQQFYSESNISLGILFTNEMNEFTLEVAASVVDSIVNALGITKNSFALVNSLASSKVEALYLHSLAVSLISIMICKRYQWPLSSNIHKVGMAGLLHDLGKKKLTQEYIDKIRFLDPSTRRIVDKRLAQASAEMLFQAKCVQSEIVDIVAHHKDAAFHTTKFIVGKDHSLAHIVGLADTFCDLTVSVTGSRVSPKVALAKIIQSGEYDPESLRILCDEFGMPTDSEFSAVGRTA
jgi:putative nucleotidyltransferase with HDIG domain